MHRTLFPVIILLWAVFPLSALRAQSGAEAFVEPAEITVGQSATYTIRIHNAPGDPDLTPPAVQGLRFLGTSRSTSISIVNARRTQSLDVGFNFAADRPGTYTIPGRVFEIRGTRFEVPPVTLVVHPMDERLRDVLRLRLVLPDRPLYVGERVPAALQLLVRPNTNASLAGMPTHESEAFALSPIGREPRQGHAFVDGRRYNYAAWDFALTPLRAGNDPLPFQLPVVYEDSSRMTRDFFGRPRPLQERVSLSTGDQPVEVRRLPVEGRPDAFRDAIGRFDVSARLSERSLQAGEPLTLTIDVVGEGNIDRLAAPVLAESPGWRVYPPRVQFTPAAEDPLERSGTRTFEILLIPENASVESVPGFTFAWFDPDSATYHEIVFEEEPVTVTPSPHAGPQIRDFRAERERARDPMTALRSPQSRVGAVSASLRPALHTPAFWATAAGPALAFVLFGLLRRRRQRLAADASVRRARARARALREAITRAETAAREQAPLEFFAAAQLAFQIALVDEKNTQRHAETLLLGDILDRLRTREAGEETAAFARTVFALAESGKYAGAVLAARDLTADLRELRTHLAHLERPA